MIGVGLGFPLMLLIVGLGLVELFTTYPLLKQIMTILSVSYLIYLAWKIATAIPIKDDTTVGKPLTLFQSTAFQWVNPKAWSMALTALTVYVPVEMGVNGPILASITYVACGIISTNTWTLLGTQIKRVLRKPRYHRIFNWVCATVLLVTLIPTLFN